MNRYDILFSIMAVWEITFFGEISRRLRSDGVSVAFLTFHEGGDAMLDRLGFDYFSLHKLKSRYLKEYSGISKEEAEEHFGITQLRDIYRHEVMRTNRKDEEHHVRKTIAYLYLMDDILRRNEIKCVVQELGGFIAPQCLYYAARRLRIPHVFIEPTIFKKRLVFTLNDIYCDLSANVLINGSADPKLLDYIQQYREQRTVVIPHKDKHSFYSMTLRRIFSLDNFRRLARKIYHKYIARKEEEYNAIGWYVIYHAMRWVRSKILTFFYKDPVLGEAYIFYPFHVPLDVQLTVRSPDFLDQEALVTKLAASLPEGYKLYIKEHDAP